MNKESIQNIWNFLGSRNLSVIIFIVSMTYSFILFMFALVVPTWWVNTIAKLVPFHILYMLFFLNITLCIIRWWPVIKSQCKLPANPQSKEETDKFKLKITLSAKSNAIQKIQEFLKTKGFQIYISEQTNKFLYSIKGRFSAMGTLLFHLSFLFLLFGVIINLLFRFEGTAILIEGQKFYGLRNQYKNISPSFLSSPPKTTFQVDKINPAFWEGKMLFTSLEAAIFQDMKITQENEIKKKENENESTTEKIIQETEIIQESNQETLRKLITLSTAEKIDEAMVTLTGFGYAPEFTLKNLNDEILIEHYLILNIFAPGSTDTYSIPTPLYKGGYDYPYTFFISFYADYAEKDGKPVSKSMDTNNIAYGLKIVRGSYPVFEGILKPNQWIEFDDLKLSFTDLKRWGNFRIVRAPGRIFIWLGLILMIAGLIYRLCFYRKEILFIEDDNGKLYLYGKFHYYQNLNKIWLENLAKKINEGLI
ncbi:MAG: cytochrome c biogenesis protein ResB [Spirochaetia bacterium]|nr:cytochrome c biogenesis protein ResB [Spirochaetia bacterium]